MWSDVISLISTTESIDDIGDVIKTPTEKEVFCVVKSISQTEFYQAQAAGLKPEIKFVLANSVDYDGEKTLKHDLKIYEVIRTYQNGEQLEITCKGGVHERT